MLWIALSGGCALRSVDTFPEVELPQGVDWSCERLAASTSCQGGGVTLGWATLAKLGRGDPRQHPAGGCVVAEMSYAGETNVYRACKGKNQVWNAVLSFPEGKEPPRARSLFDQLRFTELETICQERTGQACPRPLLPAADAP